jgi:NAD(P)-dependent dehydrogenase (short-subunit alcohol dehydrogenase family)
MILLISGWGRIVNMSSIEGLVSGRGTAAYSAAKHGVIGLTKVNIVKSLMYSYGRI